MREHRTPAGFEGAAKNASFGATDEALRRDRIVRGYDNLISNGFISRSDVYFSVPQPVRSFVADVAEESGQYWAPGRRKGLHAALRRLRPAFPHIELEVCVRFGPTESLYGDLYANLRRFELLLRGFLRGLVTNKFGDNVDDWRSAGWWQRGLRTADRRELAAEWAVRDDIEWPWQTATFGTMQKIVEGHGALVAQACRERDAKAFATDVRKTAIIRNALMHPLSGKVLREEDFAEVAGALERLVNRAHGASSQGFLS